MTPRTIRQIIKDNHLYIGSPDKPFTTQEQLKQAHEILKIEQYLFNFYKGEILETKQYV